MKAEEAATRMEPEILGCIDRHLRDRHQWRGVCDVRLAHHVEHGLLAVPGRSVWSCWTVVAHPHRRLPVAPGPPGPETGGTGATQSL